MVKLPHQLPFQIPEGTFGTGHVVTAYCLDLEVSNPGRNVWDPPFAPPRREAPPGFKSRKERLGLLVEVQLPGHDRRFKSRKERLGRVPVGKERLFYPWFQIPEGTFGTRLRLPPIRVKNHVSNPGRNVWDLASSRP